MSEQKLGTEQVEKVMNLVLEGANVADKIINEKSGGQAKLMHALALTDELAALSGLSVPDLIAQWKNIDSAEKADLIAKAKAKFDLIDDGVEALVEEVMEVGFDTQEVAFKWIAVASKFKALKKPAPSVTA